MCIGLLELTSWNTIDCAAETREIHFLTVLEAEVQDHKITVLTGLVSPETSLPDWQLAAFLLPFHVGIPRALACPGDPPSSYTGGIHSHWIRAPTSWPHFSLITSLESLSPIVVTFWDTGDWGFNMASSGGDTMQPVPLWNTAQSKPWSLQSWFQIPASASVWAAWRGSLGLNFLICKMQ